MNTQRRNNRTKKQRSNRNVLSTTQKLNELVSVNRQQVLFGQPNTKDILYPMMKQKKYTFSVNDDIIVLTSSTAAATSGGFNFTIGGLPNAGNLIGLFDRYRILMINLQFNPTGVVTTGGPIVTAIDYDDSASGSASLVERDTALVVPIGRYFERTLAPRIATAVYSGAFTSFANLPPTTWLDSGSPNVQYYGVKYFIPIQNVSAAIYQVTGRYLLQMKNNF